jgi:hypothetical protein
VSLETCGKPDKGGLPVYRTVLKLTLSNCPDFGPERRRSGKTCDISYDIKRVQLPVESLYTL